MVELRAYVQTVVNSNPECFLGGAVILQKRL